MAYPRLPFEPKYIRGLREQVQKQYHQESLWSWLLLRRVSIYISLFLSKFSLVTPNRITVVAILSAMVGVIAASRSGSISNMIIWANAFYQIAFFFDVVDGEVARLTQRTSRMGEWLDTILAHLLSAIFLTVGVQVGVRVGFEFASWLVPLVLFLRLGARSQESGQSVRTTTSLRVKFHVLNVLSSLSGGLGFLLILLVGLASDQVALSWSVGIALYLLNTVAQLVLTGRSHTALRWGSESFRKIATQDGKMVE